MESDTQYERKQMDTKTTQKVLTQITDTLDNMRRQIKLLSLVQMTIVEHLAMKDDKFMTKFITATLSQKDIRDGFTEFVMSSDDVSDAAKVFTMDMNEFINNKLEEE